MSLLHAKIVDVVAVRIFNFFIILVYGEILPQSIRKRNDISYYFLVDLAHETPFRVSQYLGSKGFASLVVVGGIAACSDLVDEIEIFWFCVSYHELIIVMWSGNPTFVHKKFFKMRIYENDKKFIKTKKKELSWQSSMWI